MEGSELTRTHPATVIVKTVKSVWQLAIGVVVFVVLGVSGGSQETPLPALWLALGAAAILLLTLAASWVQWACLRYALTEKDLVITSGWLVRKRLSIPYGRVQGVNINADLFMRMLGLAEVTVETAGGGTSESEAKLGALTLAQAEEMRTTLLHGRAIALDAPAAGAQPAGTAPDPLSRMSDTRGPLAGVESGRIEPSYTFRLTPARLVIASATSKGVPFAILAVFALGAQAVEIVGLDASEALASRLLSLALPLLIALVIGAGVIAIGAAIVVGAIRDWGFVARRAADRIETEAGLLERRMTGTPVGRIQTVRIERPPLRRLLGFVSVHADTAGFGSQTQDGRTSLTAIVPLARDGELTPVLHGLLPEAEKMPHTAAVDAGALRFYLTVPVTGSCAIAIVLAWGGSLLDPLAGLAGSIGGIALVLWVAGDAWLRWRHAGYVCDGVALGIAWGTIGLYRVRIARQRIQSLSISQNPFQRRARRATLTASTVAGSSERAYRVKHLPYDDATAILAWYETGTTR